MIEREYTAVSYLWSPYNHIKVNFDSNEHSLFVYDFASLKWEGVQPIQGALKAATLSVGLLKQH